VYGTEVDVSAMSGAELRRHGVSSDEHEDVVMKGLRKREGLKLMAAAEKG